MSTVRPLLLMPWSLLRSSCARLPPARRRLLLLVVGAGVVWGAVRGLLFLLQEWRLQRALRGKRAEVEEAKSQLRQRLAERGVPLSRRESVTRLPASQLLSQLRQGRLTPTAVLAAFQASALAADDSVNCVADVVPGAEEEAERLQAMPAEDRQRLPLFGLPVSVKEHLALAGTDCTFGNPSYLGRGRSAEAVVVRLLRQLGAIPFARTNMSQMGFAIDCRNALFGETLNPHDLGRSPGGSSGGEAALLAAGGSPLGIGSDVGGSIRIPAALCGVCGFKPTAERVSSLGCPPVEHAQSYVVDLSIGPLGRDVESLVVATEALFSQRMGRLDPHCAPMPFRRRDVSAPLNVGYYINLKGAECVRAVPAVQRGVMVAKEALERRGHRVLPFSPPHADHMLGLCFGAYFTDGGEGVRAACESEKVTRDLALAAALFSLPSLARAALVVVVRPFSLLLSRQLAAMHGCGSVYRLWRFLERLGAYTWRFMASWQAQKLDAVICPALPFVAPPLGHSTLLSGAVVYCSLYNVLNYPAGVVPVTRVKPGDLARLEEEYPADDLLLRLLRAGQRGTEGLPVGVQCVAMKWQDELCLAVMKEVEEGLLELEEEEEEEEW